MRRRTLILTLTALGAAVMAGGVGAAWASPATISPLGEAPASISPPSEAQATGVPMAPLTNGPVSGGKPDVASISGGQPLTSDEALAFLEADTFEFPALTDSYAKQMRLGDIAGSLGGLPDGYSAEQQVVVATGEGTFIPSFGRDGLSLAWGSLLFDADTGGMMGAFSNPGTVPEVIKP